MSAPVSASVLDILGRSAGNAAAPWKTSAMALQQPNVASNIQKNKEKSFSDVFDQSARQAQDVRQAERARGQREEKSRDPGETTSARDQGPERSQARAADRSAEKQEVAAADRGGENLPADSDKAASAEGSQSDAIKTDKSQQDEATEVTDQLPEELVQMLTQLETQLRQSGEFSDEEVSQFMASLTASLAGLQQSGKLNGKGGDILLTDQDAKVALKQVLMSMLNQSANQQSAGDAEGKGAEVSEMLKSLLGKSAPTEGVAKSGTEGDKVDVLIARLADSAQQGKAGPTNPVPGQIALQMTPARAEASFNAPYVTSLQQSVQQGGWKDGMAQKVVWMVSQNIQSAKVHLNPAELGPIEMKIQVHKDQAHIQVQSPHAVTRDLMEGTVNRLREMLAEQGISLSQFDVSGQSGQQAGAQGDGEGSGAGGGNSLAGDVEPEQVIAEQTLGLDQLVDYYV